MAGPELSTCPPAGPAPPPVPDAISPPDAKSGVASGVAGVLTTPPDAQPEPNLLGVVARPAAGHAELLVSLRDAITIQKRLEAARAPSDMIAQARSRVELLENQYVAAVSGDPVQQAAPSSEPPPAREAKVEVVVLPSAAAKNESNSSVAPWYFHIQNGAAYNPGDGHYYYTAAALRAASATGASGDIAFDTSFGASLRPVFSRNNGTAESDGLGPLHFIPGPVGRGVAIAESLGDCVDGKGCWGGPLSAVRIRIGNNPARLPPILAIDGGSLNGYRTSTTGGGTGVSPLRYLSADDTWPGLVQAPDGLSEQDAGSFYVRQVSGIIRRCAPDSRLGVLDLLMKKVVPDAMAGHNLHWKANPVPGHPGVYFGVTETANGVPGIGLLNGELRSGEATLEELMRDGARALMRRR
jgi:hypothetical protein